MMNNREAFSEYFKATFIDSKATQEEVAYEFFHRGVLRGKAQDAELIAELVSELEDARDDVSECLNNAMPQAGWERFDRRIQAYQEQLKRIDALLAKVKERV